MEITTPKRRLRDKNIPVGKPVFNVVIAYDDFAAGKLAKETYDCLTHHLGSDFLFENQMWKFDVLAHPRLKDMAIKDAASAHLVIISTHGTGELPQHVKSWIDHWVSSEGSTMAMVALVDKSAGRYTQTDMVRPYLQAVARKAGMDFFAQPEEWFDREDEFSWQQMTERAQRTSTAVANFLSHHALHTRVGLAG